MQLRSDLENGVGRAAAAKLALPSLREGFPQDAAWATAVPVAFCADWQGRHPDPLRETEVRLLWSSDFLFIRFRARYRNIHVFPEAQTRRDQLWLRDVAEVFLQPDAGDPAHYREFEISPNGSWLDLDIHLDPGAGERHKSDLHCDLGSRVTVDVHARVWVAELALPIRCLTKQFRPGKSWRVNFFRVEGQEPERFYSAWLPTHTPQPNFHVPEAFGELRFSSG